MPTAFVRAYRAEEQANDDGPISFIASSEAEARDGFSIAHDAWSLTNFNRNPLMLWAHRYDQPPIGKVKARIDKDAKVLKADVTFDMTDPFAADIARKYREGFLNAVSVGFNIHELNGEPAKDDQFFFWPRKGDTVTKCDLLELSAVPVPADPKALAERRARGLAFDGLLDFSPERIADAIAQRLDANRPGAIRVTLGGPKADSGAEWDAAAELAKATEAAALRTMHAYVNPASDPQNPTSYRFPHHAADGTLNLKACEIALAKIDAADIPDADKPAVRAHFEAHLREFGQEPPERSDPAAEVIWPGTALLMARLFLDMADDADDDERKARYRQLERLYRRTGHEPPDFLPRAELCLLGDEEIRGLFLAGEGDLLGWDPDAQRKGAVLSARNRGDLEQAIALVRGVLDRAEKDAEEEKERAFLTQLMPNDTGATDWLRALAG